MELSIRVLFVVSKLSKLNQKVEINLRRLNFAEIKTFSQTRNSDFSL